MWFLLNVILSNDTLEYIIACKVSLSDTILDNVTEYYIYTVTK